MAATSPAPSRQDTTAAEATVTVAGVTKRYGHHRALAGASMTLRAGSMCALLGPNGAGKSTLLGVLSTLVRPTLGTVSYTIGDRVMPMNADLRRHIGVLAHSAFIYGQLSAIENLAFYGRLYGLADVTARATALLDRVGLDDNARLRPAQTYSRGMLQRLALARALLHDPRVLLLDEPFTGLDRAGAVALGEALRDARQRGCVLLVITHDLDPIDGLADHVVVLRRGKLVYEDRVGDGVSGFSAAALKDLYHRHTE